MTELAWIATRCLSAAEFRFEAVEWIDREVGIDAAVVAQLDGASPAVRHATGVNQTWIDRFDASIGNYRLDLKSILDDSQRQGSASGERTRLERWAALPDREGLEEDLVFPLGLRVGTTVAVRIRDAPIAIFFLARSKTGPLYTSEEAALLGSVAPVLALGEALHRRSAAVAPANPMPRPRRAAPGTLTARERNVVEYVVLGLTSRQIALALGTAHNTVRNQLASIFKKLSVGSRAELTAVAIAEGLVDPPRSTGEAD